jgi:iron(III) transport system permease protein
VWLSLRNTILVGTATATVGTIIYAVLMYTVVRTRLRGRKIVDMLSWLPWGVPGLVLGLGFIWAYVGGFLPTRFLYGTLWILIIAFLVRSMPMGCRVMTGTMHQLANELEESSRVLGGSWLYTFRRIMIPLIIPSAITVWILTFMITAGDLTTAILLIGPGTEVLPVLMFEYYTVWARTEAVAIGVINTFLILGIAVLFQFLGSKLELPSS